MVQFMLYILPQNKIVSIIYALTRHAYQSKDTYYGTSAIMYSQVLILIILYLQVCNFYKRSGVIIIIIIRPVNELNV